MLVYAGNWDTPNKGRAERVHRWKLLDDAMPTLTRTAGSGSTNDAVLVVYAEQPKEFAMNAEAQLSMFSSEELPASPSASQDLEKDWQIRVATSCLRILPLLQSIAPAGWFGRTSPASYPVAEETTLPASFAGWGNAGMGSPTEFLTLSTSEFHSAAVACSLSDILEAGNVPQRFFLSATACKGILRRAERRGKDLPIQLHQALQAVAGASSEAATPEGKTL